MSQHLLDSAVAEATNKQLSLLYNYHLFPISDTKATIRAKHDSVILELSARRTSPPVFGDLSGDSGDGSGDVQLKFVPSTTTMSSERRARSKLSLKRHKQKILALWKIGARLAVGCRGGHGSSSTTPRSSSRRVADLVGESREAGRVRRWSDYTGYSLVGAGNSITEVLSMTTADLFI